MYEMQQKTTWAALKTGIVISIALFILFASVFFANDVNALFSHKVSVFVKISNIQGLRAGAPVWLFGAEIGEVKSLSINGDGIIASLSLDSKYSKSIYKDATASVMTMGILGDKFFELKQGNFKSQLISAGDTISGMSSVDFEQITSAATTTMAEMDSVILQLAILLKNITSSSGTFAQLLNDSTLYKQLTLSSENLSRATNDYLTSNGTIKKLIKNSELYENLNSTASQISDLVNRVDHGLGNGGMISALVNDSTMAFNLRETIAS